MAKAKKRRVNVRRRLTAKQWCETGHRFEVASHALMSGKPDAAKELLGTPYIVLRSFAVECFLKCLAELNNREALIEHNFELLFDEISDADKKELRRRWREEYTPKMRKWNEWKDRPWCKFPLSLRGAFRFCGDAFIVVRYGPERGKYPFPLMNFPLRMQDYIWEIRPDFRPAHDPLLRDPNAEIVEAKHNDLARILARAAELNRQGAGPLRVLFRADRSADTEDGSASQGG